MVKPKLNLDIGCGENVQPGFVGMDKRALSGIEIIHDLEIFPWPVKNASCSIIKCSHVIEHIKPWLQIDFINECWRVLEIGGHLLISTPYGGSFRYYQDPTHCCPWVEATPAYFDPREPLYQVYKPKPWQIEHLFWNVHGDIEVNMVKINENHNRYKPKKENS